MEILTDIASKIGFEWHLALTSLINFLIIFFLLVKFALPNVKKTIEARTKKIKEGLQMREDADKIVDNAKTESLEINRSANIKAQSTISLAEENAKKILVQTNEKSQEIIKLAEKEKKEAKNLGLKDAENILSKDMSKILSKISDLAFSGNITADSNSEFIKKVLKDSYSVK